MYIIINLHYKKKQLKCGAVGTHHILWKGSIKKKYIYMHTFYFFIKQYHNIGYINYCSNFWIQYLRNSYFIQQETYN